MEPKQILEQAIANWKIGDTISNNLGDNWYWENWTFKRISRNRVYYECKIGSSSGYICDYNSSGTVVLSQLVEWILKRKYSYINSDPDRVALVNLFASAINEN